MVSEKYLQNYQLNIVNDKIHNELNRQARLKQIEEKKAQRLKLLLQDSKKKHDKCQKLISDEIENKKDAATKHRSREELALKGHQQLIMKLDRESYRSYAKNLKEMKELHKYSPTNNQIDSHYNTISNTRRTMMNS